MDYKEAFSALEKLIEIEDNTNNQEDFNSHKYNELTKKLEDYIKNITINKLLKLHEYTKKESLISLPKRSINTRRNRYLIYF